MLTRSSKKSKRPAPEYYVWALESGPVSVHLSTEVVDELSSRIAQNATAGRPNEFGGLLLGRVHAPNGDTFIVSVDQIEPIPIEHYRGPSYTLSKSDIADMHRRIQKYMRNPELNVVGFFRSHSRPGLFLDEHDFTLFGTLFAHPASVALVCRPAGSSPAAAGFFFWEDGDVRRAKTFKEFPLDSELLVGKRNTQQAPSLETGTSRPTQHPPGRVVGPNAVLASVATVSAVLLSLGFYALSSNRTISRSYSPLALSAKPDPGGLKLTWDHNHSLVRENRPAALFIRDGGEEKRIPIAEDQLRQGVLIYQPNSSDVNIRLQVGEFNESVRAIAPLASQKEQPQSADPKPAPYIRAGETIGSRARSTARPAIIPPEPQPPAPKSEDPPVAPEITPVPVRLDRPSFGTREPPRPSPPPAQVEVEKGSPIKRAFAAIPGALFGLGKKDKDFTPPRVIRQVTPSIPNSIKLDDEVKVSVKVSLDETGRVRSTDLVTRRADSRLVNAAMDAARRWRFQPARLENKPVDSSVVVHFTFGSTDN